MSDPMITWPGHTTRQNAPSESGDIKTPKPAVILPNAAESLHAFGDEIFVQLGGAGTGGKYTIFIGVTPPGAGPPPHYHKNEDEWFFPLEGRVEFFLNGSWQEVPVGSVIILPRGTVHTFRNCGKTPLKMLTHTAPAGFEIFFERCAAEFARPGPPDMERIIEISAEHGIHFVTE